MKWATVFQQAAARPDAVAEIARLNGTTPAEILSQVELQTTCVGSNYDLARKAKDALDRQTKKQSRDADQAEREASDDAKKLQELREKITEEVKKKAKEAVEEQQKRDQAQRDEQRRAADAKKLQEEMRQRITEEAKKAAKKAVEEQQQQREQAQREAQRGAARPGTQAGSQRVSPPTRQAGKAQGGCSRTFKFLLGTAVLIGACLTLYYAYKAVSPSIGGGIGPGPGARATPTCGPLVTELRKCPWMGEGYGVEPCGPGFCWDGGPQGSLACKQEQAVENSGRTYTTDLVCSEGYTAERDPCTNVILRCVKQ